MSGTRLVLDLETTSLVDLRVTGVHVYANHPSTKVTVLCYALGNGPVRSWTGGPCPDDLRAAILAGATVVAHNYLFELNIWAAVLEPLGFPDIALWQWSCTMARALVAGLPASLEMAGHALGLAIQKDSAARDMMLRFARPRSLNPLTWWHETDPARFAALVSYCAQDVAAERELDRAVPELSPREYEIFLADHAINQRGVRVDLPLVDRMRTLSEAEKARINARLNSLTNGQITSGAQVARLVEWLTDLGVAVPMLDKGGGSPPRPTLGAGAVEFMLAQPGLPGHVPDVLRCRQDVSRSSTAKLVTIANRVSADHRVRGGFQYYGANRTGRWAGRGVQWQNFPRGTIRDVHGAVALVNDGADVETLDLLFEDSPMGVLASMLRSTIEAAPGHLLVSCDLSQIEARVLVWLAGQDDMIDVFRRGEDVYTYTAKALGSDNRQFGKVLVLATGFGMGPKRFRDTARTFGVILTEDQADDAVQGWRRLNSKVVTLWWDAHRIALQVAGAVTGAAVSFRGMTFARRSQSLDIILPSGRALVYREPRILRHPEHGHVELVYRGVEQGRWAWVRSWPGKLCVAEDTLVLTEQGWMPIQLVSPANRVWDGDAWVDHDGLICNGIADCIVLDGVAMTPDHEVLTSEGWRHAEISSGLDRAPVELPDGVNPPGSYPATWVSNPQTRSTLAGALRLWEDLSDAARGFHEREDKVLWLSGPGLDKRRRPHTRHVEASGVGGVALHERSLPTAYTPCVGAVWGTGDHCLPRVAGFIRGVLAGHGANLSTGFEYRPDRQRRRVFTGKLCLENPQGTEQQPASSAQKVYDIVNAGSRRRFVIAGRDGPLIVHNCENLVQAIARDVMAEAIIRCHRKGPPLIATVHDELISEVPAARAPDARDWLMRAMNRTPKWAPGLPVAAAATVGPRYRKEAA